MNFIIPIPIFPAQVMVSIGQTIPQIIQAVRKWPKTDADVRYDFIRFLEADDPSSAIDGGIFTIPDRGYVLLTVFKPIKTAEGHGHLAHEIFHAVEHIASHAGITHSEDSSETFAYLISYITEIIYKKIRR